MTMPSPAVAPLLEVCGLCKSYGAARAVDDVNFSVNAGEPVAVVGTSGSGKSTIARIIARLVTPSAGAIFLRGRNIILDEPTHASAAYRRAVQMVFQDPYGALNPARRVRHHLAGPLALAGKADTRAALVVAITELLESVGLYPANDFADRYPHELSGGQRQRICIARALAVGPQFLVADEPTSMLDPSSRGGILALLAAQSRIHGRGLLFITHDLGAARAIADRIVVLADGKVVESGPIASVLDTPAHPSTQALLAALGDLPLAPPTVAK